jgi:hypothetical protein
MLSTRNADFNGIVGMSATNVCNQGHFRRHMLTASFTARDPIADPRSWFGFDEEAGG